jgi:hypothetical protein
MRPHQLLDRASPEIVLDRHAGGGAGRERDEIAARDVAFANDGDVEARAPALQETLDHLVVAEPDAELVARQPRLRDGEFGGSHREPIANPDIGFEEPLCREVLTKRSPWQIDPGQLLLPELVVL